MTYLNTAIEFYNSQLRPILGEPEGCTERDIESLECRLDAKLPEAYKQYVRWMGKDKLGLLRGTNCFIDDVIENTEYLPELLEDNNVDFKLTEKYFVFYMHQGYTAVWFELPVSVDDPECFGYSEGDYNNEVKKVGNFSSFMNKVILDLGELRLANEKNIRWWKFWRR